MTERQLDLVTYRTIRTALVSLTPGSIAQYDIPADSIVTCAAAAEPGWLRWERDGHIEGYLRETDVERAA